MAIQWFAYNLLPLLNLSVAMPSMPTSGHADDGHVHQRAWEWWLTALVGIAAMGFGTYGLWIYDVANDVPVDIASVGYHTLQLFVLHAPHLEHAVPWQLNVGRWLAAAVVIGTVARGLLAVFRSECRLIMARFRHGHIIICGLGRLGMQLAHEFQRDGSRVVAIETSGSAGRIETVTNAGMAVITGDACNPDTLRRAVVGRASRIIAVCDDEQTNVAIAATVGELLAGQVRAHESNSGDGKNKFCDASAVECWLFITDPRLRQTFQQAQLFPHTGAHYRVNVRGLDLFELAARQILRKVPVII